MILLLSALDDPVVDLVAVRLQCRGARFFRFDEAEFPARAQITAANQPRRPGEYQLRWRGETIDLGEIRAAWDHRPGRPQPAAGLPANARRFVARESARFIDDVWRSIDCRWFPAHKDVVFRVQHKASQLSRARALGFSIPATLITNDPAEFREFYRRHGGRIVSKVFHQNSHGDFLCMTQLVSNRDSGYAGSIRHSPVIFQAYVPKQLELRVTVVGRRVLTAAILSQETHRTRHDWRHADLAHTRYEPFQLPPEEEQRCVALVEQLGLCFGAIDLVLTPDGRYVFLEINPSGQWRWVETLTGLPIADTIADWLIQAGAGPVSPGGDGSRSLVAATPG